MSTSSSDRHEEARLALAEWSGLPAAGNSRIMGAKIGSARRMAAALRALIEPAPTVESPEVIADRLLSAHKSQRVEAAENEVRALIALAFNAGIQSAWESWEPETAPGMGEDN